MKVKDIADKLQLTPFSAADPDRTVVGGYCGDLLSWVMGKAEADTAWITIMSNINVLAVATLTDVSLVILAEGVNPDAGVTEQARSRGINLYGSDKSSYELAAAIHRLIGS